jgi:hypothetical protein
VQVREEMLFAVLHQYAIPNRVLVLPTLLLPSASLVLYGLHLHRMFIPHVFQTVGEH